MRVRGRRPLVAQILFSSLLLAGASIVLTSAASAQDAVQEMAPGDAQRATTRTELSVSTRESGVGNETVLTAHVTDALGRTLPEDGAQSGVVSFETARGSLGSALVKGDGSATLTVTSLPQAEAGLAVRAVYHPGAGAESVESDASSARAAGSISAAVTIAAATSGVPDFSITATPATLSVTAGQYATTALTITPVNGFSEQVTLSCSNLPAQVTCNFSPVIATTADGAFTSTLEVQTQAPSGANAMPDFGVGRGSRVALAWLLPGLLALAGMAGARRRALQGVALAALVCAGLGVSGCSARYGYNHHPPQVATGTLAGSYTVVISASGNDGSAVTVHTYNLAVTVK